MEEEENVIVPLCGMKRTDISKQESVIVPTEVDMVDQGIKFHSIDETCIKRKRPPRYRIMLSFFGIFSYVGVYFFDGMVLSELYTESQWLMFMFTLACFVLPTIVVQLLSLKWFHDDKGLYWYTVLIHSLCLGPIQRYFYIIYYGLSSRSKMDRAGNSIKRNPGALVKDAMALNLNDQSAFENFKKYLVNWRDVSMLRFIYAFLESCPQATLQLYIIVDHIVNNSNGEVRHQHMFSIIKLIVSFGAIAVGIVSYNSDLRDSVGKGLSIPGYITQCLYRILLLASRVVVFVLFAMEYKLLVFAVMFVQWLLMLVWVRLDGFVFFKKEKACCNNTCENTFQMILGYIYVFSYIATRDGSTALRQMAYYILFHGENTCLMLVWIYSRTGFRRSLNMFELSAVLFVASVSLVGASFHALYYRCFHPSLDRIKERRTLKESEVEALIVVRSADNFFSRAESSP